MKTAIIGSRGLRKVKIEKYLPKGISLIISGGAIGIDTIAEKYADKNGIPKLIFLPNYDLYGKIAPLIRNKLIVENADTVIAFWDGKSRGTKHALNYAKALKKTSNCTFNRKIICVWCSPLSVWRSIMLHTPFYNVEIPRCRQVQLKHSLH